MSTNDDETQREHRALLDHAATTKTNLYTLLDIADPFAPPATSTPQQPPTGSPNGPTTSELKQAWRKAALKHHPDKLRAGSSADDQAAAADRLAECRRAFEVLSDPAARKRYDDRFRALAAERERREKQSGARRTMAERLEKAERRASGGAGVNGMGSPMGGAKRNRAGEVETEEERKTRDFHRFATEQARKKSEFEEKRRRRKQEQGQVDANTRPSSLYSTSQNSTPAPFTPSSARPTPGFSFTPKASPRATNVQGGTPGANAAASPSLYESTMARLKEAERKRKEMEPERLEREARENEADGEAAEAAAG